VSKESLAFKSVSALNGADLDRAVYDAVVASQSFASVTPVTPVTPERQGAGGAGGVRNDPRHRLARAIVANLWGRYRRERQLGSRLEKEASSAKIPEWLLKQHDGAKTEAWNAACVSSMMLYGTGEFEHLHKDIGLEGSRRASVGTLPNGTVPAHEGDIEVGVDELEGWPLSYAVATALGGRYSPSTYRSPKPHWIWDGQSPLRFSVDIFASHEDSQEAIEFAGALVLREGMELRKLAPDLWQARIDLDEGDALVEDRAAPTAQLAVLRCFVASRLGPTVVVAADYVQRGEYEACRRRERGG
jgi:hypothetical protein